MAGAEVGPASVFTITLVLGVGFSAGFSGDFAGFSALVDSLLGEADFLSDLLEAVFSGTSDFAVVFSDLAVFSEVASDFSTTVSVL